MSEASARKQQKYRASYDLLAAIYGEPERRRYLPPVDQLVNTILSQQTTGANRERAFQALKTHFDSWEEVMEADVSEVREAILPAGLANQKAPRIQEALRFLMRERGELNLDFLADMPVQEAKAWLMQIRGVGPKTASIILLFTFGLPVFPVDTHVHRLARRIGLIGTKVTADKAHEILENIVEPAAYYAYHVNLIRHGREVCHARQPLCQICVVQEWCDYFNRTGEWTERAGG